MGQESVADMEIGIEGQTADSGPKFDVPALNEEATDSIPFGVMVALGTADDGALLLAATSDKLKGVSMFNHYYMRGAELDDDGALKPGTVFDVRRQGRVLVRPEDSVTPASGVHVRATGTGQPGAFRGADDGANSIDISSFAKWLTSASGGELAVLEIDMTSASEAVADS